MTNKEKYKQAFSALHSSCEMTLEVEKMAILVDQAVQQGGAGLTDNQRENFYYALGVIAQNLQQICTPEESL